MLPEMIRWRLLYSAGEDYEGLYLAKWEFGVPADPEPDAPTEFQIEQTLATLIRDGLVQLLRHGESIDQFIPVGEDDVPAILSRPAIWVPAPELIDQVYFTTTEAGDALLRHRPPGIPPMS